MAKVVKKQTEEKHLTEGVRINKFLADAGVCSRREADKYIESGKVLIDGVAAQMGSRVMFGQKVVFNGKELTKDEQLVLIALNKPQGIVCTTDSREPDNVINFLKYGKRIYPIGRLDKDSEGLLLLTNDGDIVNKILRAGNHHEKEYIVKVNKMITKEFIKGMEGGVPILDTVTKPCKVTQIDKHTFKIILVQGLNRQIRRMCEYFGYRVMYLQRVRIMNIQLGHLKVGSYRKLNEGEIHGLMELIRYSTSQPEAVKENQTNQVDRERKNGTEKTKNYRTNRRTE